MRIALARAIFPLTLAVEFVWLEQTVGIQRPGHPAFQRGRYYTHSGRRNEGARGRRDLHMKNNNPEGRALGSRARARR